jgi:hypothetical protein
MGGTILVLGDTQHQIVLEVGGFDCVGGEEQTEFILKEELLLPPPPQHANAHGD